MSQDAYSSDSLDHSTGNRTTNQVDSHFSIDPSINPENIVDKYWELKTRFQQLEEKRKGDSNSLQRSSDCDVRIREERDSLLERISELEKQPKIRSLGKSVPLKTTGQANDDSIHSMNRARKRAGKPINTSPRRSKRFRTDFDPDLPHDDELAVAALLIEKVSRSRSSSPLTQQADVAAEGLVPPTGDEITNTTLNATPHRPVRGKRRSGRHPPASKAASTSCTQSTDTNVYPPSSSGPVIDPSLTERSTTPSEKGSASAASPSDPSPTTPAQPSASSSMASNPYAAYLTSNNPYAYYYLHPHLPPGMHPGMAMSGIPPPGMYVPLPAPPMNSPKLVVPVQSQQLNDPSGQAQTKPKRLKSHAVTTKSFNIPIVPRDSQGRPLLPLNVGIMTVISLGEVCLREHFHTERYIFPAGYQVTRRYLSTQDKNREVVYHCTILDGGDGPKFQIVPSDAPELTVIAGTATGAWSNIVRKANAIRNRQHSNSVSGPDFFGLGQNTIKHLIQQLPNADKLRDYVWQNFVEGGPLGGRHAAVVPALPEDYGSSMAMGAYYRPGTNKPSTNQVVNSKHYPPYSIASNPPSQSRQDSVPIDPQLAAPTPHSVLQVLLPP
ncbi:hypothetical protein E1B28_012116 [Marasmius oreades]|uniref:Transforming growth factor beta regulator 1 n=1 Tax=Marasmius oreades TaxID=181124 RepID=A0A9P7RRT8_9AGAR|nr:uncharacterized protein E1B28_012116 [Marasmius oreades]KAG7088086.1 hypothetical protein E1B28_012116 [Marasmius oreades]